MKIAVLFDGAGLSRLGLEQAGHKCTGFELDPSKHYLSKFVGSGNSVLADVRDVDLTGYDAVWASPPCQARSTAKNPGTLTSPYAVGLLDWSLNLPADILWVENVLTHYKAQNQWGTLYNAAQFLEVPIQQRNRIIGGRYKAPNVFSSYKKTVKGICPAITASEYKGTAGDRRRASRFYGRRLTLHEAAYHQRFVIPEEWNAIPNMVNPKTGKLYTSAQWRNNLYEAIGNGVPVYMAKAFGEVYNVHRAV